MHSDRVDLIVGHGHDKRVTLGDSHCWSREHAVHGRDGHGGAISRNRRVLNL